jgi:regulator of replication initiation timing
MYQNLDWVYLDSNQSISIEESLETPYKEIEELKAQLDVINEDRLRLKSTMQGLVNINTKLSIHNEIIKKVFDKLTKKTETVEIENQVLRETLKKKDCLLRDMKKLLNCVPQSCNRRNNCYGDYSASPLKLRRRPIVTLSPSGISQAFYSKSS